MTFISISDECALTGYCVRVAPEVFRLSATSAEVASDIDLDSDDLPERLIEAEGMCPMQAIQISAERGGTSC